MNKLSVRDKCILLFMITAFVIYGGYNFLWIPVNAQITELESRKDDLKSQIGDQTQLDNKIRELEAQNVGLIKTIGEYKGSQGGKSLNTEDFLVFLGNECNKNSVEMVRFNDLGCIRDADDVWKVRLDFELRGSLNSLNQVCKAIDDINIRYSVGGLSLRKNDNQAYLSRFFDDISRLEWYKDEAIDKVEAPENTPSETEQPDYPIPDTNTITPKAEPLLPAPIPDPTPHPAPPSPEPRDESITDRLDRLLEQIHHSKGYKAVLLTSNPEYGLYFGGSSTTEQMRLNITVQFVMHAAPDDFTNSFMLPDSGV